MVVAADRARDIGRRVGPGSKIDLRAGPRNGPDRKPCPELVSKARIGVERDVYVADEF